MDGFRKGIRDLEIILGLKGDEIDSNDWRGKANYKDTKENIIQFCGKSHEYHRWKFRRSSQG